MAEWSKATVLKTVDPQGSGGSNPSFSANHFKHLRLSTERNPRHRRPSEVTDEQHARLLRYSPDGPRILPGFSPRDPGRSSSLVSGAGHRSFDRIVFPQLLGNVGGRVQVNVALTETFLGLAATARAAGHAAEAAELDRVSQRAQIAYEARVAFLSCGPQRPQPTCLRARPPRTPPACWPRGRHAQGLAGPAQTGLHLMGDGHAANAHRHQDADQKSTRSAAARPNALKPWATQASRVSTWRNHSQKTSSFLIRVSMRRHVGSSGS